MITPEEKQSSTRRTVLRGSGVVLAGLVAGCTSSDPDDDEADDEEPKTPPPQYAERTIPEASDRLAWVTELDASPIGDPIWTADTIHVPGSEAHFALDTDGTANWRLELEDSQNGVPIIVDGRLYYTTASGDIVCVGLDDQNVHWQQHVEVENGAMFGDPAVAGETLVVTTVTLDESSYDREESVGEIIAFDTNGGEQHWSHETETGFFSGVAAHADMVYAATDTVYAHDVQSGTVDWTFELEAVAEHRPIVDEDGLYVSDETTFYALDRVTGEKQWAIGLEVAMDEPPILGDERVYGSVYRAELGEDPSYSDEQQIIAIDREDGSTVWKTGVPMATARNHSLAIHDDRLFTGTTTVIEHDLHTGDQRWEYVAPSSQDTSSYEGLIVEDGQICAVGRDGLVHLIETADEDAQGDDNADS